MAAVREAPAQNGPRTPMRSERKVSVMIMKKQRRYGGALRPLDWIVVKVPI